MERDRPGDRRRPLEPPVVDVNHRAPYRLVEENLRRAMEFYGRSRQPGEARHLGGLELICSGTDMAMFNPALLTEPVTGGEAELDRRIVLAASHFGTLGYRWSCWLCEDLLPIRVRRLAPEVFARRGMRRVVTVPGMLAECLLPPKRPLPEVECRRVADAPTRHVFGQLTAVAFGLPCSSASEIYEPEPPWQGDFLGFVGYVNGEPVATAGTVVTSDVVGFYSIGTLPQHRRRGYAEALMRKAFDFTGRGLGLRRAVLQSTASGQRLYEQLGFRTVTRFSIYVSP